MYTRDLASSLARRWYLALVCIAITAGLCLLVGAKVPPTYEAKASVVLVPPKSTEDPEANRYLSLSSLTQAADVLTRSLGSDSTREAIKAAAPTAKFEVVTDFATSAPILIITAKAHTSAAAQQTVNLVLDRVPVNLQSLQEPLGISEKSQITALLVSQDEKPKASQKTRYRAIAVTAALGLLVSAVSIGAVDSLVLRRRRNREVGLAAGSVDADDEVNPIDAQGADSAVVAVPAKPVTPAQKHPRPPPPVPVDGLEESIRSQPSDRAEVTR